MSSFVYYTKPRFENVFFLSQIILIDDDFLRIAFQCAEIIEQRTDIIFMIYLGRRQLVYLLGRSITVNNGNNSRLDTLRQLDFELVSNPTRSYIHPNLYSI